MAAEYLANEVQSISLNAPAIFTASIPCTKGYVYHEDGTGIFILRGITCNQCFATYQVTFNGNIAVADGGTITPIAIAIAINGEPRLTSRAIFVPAAVGDYGNVTSTCIIKVPKGCCFTVAVENTSGPAAPGGVAPEIIVQNANLTVTRIS